MKIPEDIHLTFDPTVLLKVTFPETKAPPIHLTAGIHLPRNATVGPPSFGILETPAVARLGRGPFVVATVDPDAPTPQSPTAAQIRHFLGANFILGQAGSDGVAKLTNSTPALSGFLQPTPPPGSDAHRYIFLLFKQPPGFSGQTLVNSSTPISNFNISSFAQTVGLGEPLGGTFMLVAPDSVVNSTGNP
ncbi:PEBP-like protein [Artomyces pyxidatus]|uniref:PEBP-like protein n=1 Tax=Artomyces pyxidatus TaxID=48021 RepID=A0ACB8SV62_9AGAM|nr:PEBP-like protein [Artomyces pyxidatus]